MKIDLVFLYPANCAFSCQSDFVLSGSFVFSRHLHTDCVFDEKRRVRRGEISIVDATEPDPFLFHVDVRCDQSQSRSPLHISVFSWKITWRTRISISLIRMV